MCESPDIAMVPRIYNLKSDLFFILSWLHKVVTFVSHLKLKNTIVNNNFTQMGFNPHVYIYDFIHYFWLCLHKVLTFQLLWNNKKSTFEFPISILLKMAFIPSSHIFLTFENSKIARSKLFHRVFRKCIKILYSDQVPSH